MELIKKKPVTSSLRNLITLKNNNLLKKPLVKYKLKGLKNSNGRNNSGKITVRHKGGGHKKRYRIINFKRNTNSTGIICSIEYDPNRNTFISSVYDLTLNNFFYILSPNGLNVGEVVKSGNNIEPFLGYSLPLSEISAGSVIHNVALKKNKISKLARSAGTFATVEKKTSKNAIVKLSSGKKQIISLNCYATIGVVSNDLFFLTKMGKAGKARWLNIRPSVRGVAMNPIDHPHGGGEGKKSGKGKTPWGKNVKKGLKKKFKLSNESF